MEHYSHKKLIGILVLISFFLLMFGNHIISLTHPDEVFYIETAKEMVKYNSWLTPMIFDEPQFEKPILAYALFALAIKFFGLTPFVARFFPALFGMLGVGVMYWIAWGLFRQKRTAFLSGFMMGSCFIYMALSRAVLTDMIFSVLIAISLGFFVWAYYDQKYVNRRLFFCFVFSALAVMTKGLLGVVFPAATIFIFLITQRDLGFMARKGSLWGLLGFLIIAVPWHVLMYMNHGQWFIDEYFLNVHVRRLTDAEHSRLDNWYFYIVLMFVGVLPWSFFWIPAVKRIYRQFKEKAVNFDKTVFLLSWIAGVYLFTQPAHSKLASYVFPAFFTIILLLADYLNAALKDFEHTKRARALTLCGYAFIVLIFVAAVGGITAGIIYKSIVVNLFPIYLYAAILFTVAVLIFVFNKKQQYVKMIFSYAGVSVGLLSMLFFAKPYAEPWVSCIDISRSLKKIDQSDTVVLASKFYVRGVRFYTDRKMAVIDINGKGFFSPHPIPFFDFDYKVYDFLESQPVTYAVVKEGDRLDLERIIRERPYTMEELDYIGGKYIIKLQRNDK
ncbi:MAG: glycosyltransferase family 39 protein [Candidatus Omnitrophica bacterium]|nr:glycosyltransferase family 39 protein [Candidatus Omnitrophota bacterium]